MPTLSSLRHLVRFERACLPCVAPNPVANASTCPELQACPKIARLPGRSCPAAARSVALAYPTYRSHQDLQRPGRARVHCARRRFPGHVPRMHIATEPSAGWLLVRQTGSPLCPPCPPCPRPRLATPVPAREMLNLTKSPSCPCLPCTFPPARRFRPLGLWQPSLGGDPPVNARLLGGPFHWEI